MSGDLAQWNVNKIDDVLQARLLIFVEKNAFVFASVFNVFW